ncbi:uncharacterized protein LOC133522440 isoform X2 [Cydia pomonella]|nr:uncharacterized protein LOC133522440 isoform X2 [Cydia pomonella]
MEDPVYVQAFVSRMMGKYPLKNEKMEDGVLGISTGANLGYEPYWTDVPDRPWKDKCARCPELFKRYGRVCAMDSTGEVLVNITMCKLLQMNCLAGIVEGNTTGISEDWVDKDDYFVVQDGWARFVVRLDMDLTVQLSLTPDQNYPNYQMIIDGWNGYSSALYKNGYLIQKTHANYRSLLGKEQWAEYVIHWDHVTGWLLMTRSSYSNWRSDKLFHLNVYDADPFPIKYIAVGGKNNNPGEWIIKDLPTGFVVNELSACKDSRPGMARPVVTNPTDVPFILSRHSPANIGFFSRVNYAGVQQGNATHLGNVSFLTREEY